MSRRLRIFWYVIVIAALWLGGLFWFVRGMTDMAPPAEMKSADAIVVLTGGSNRLEAGFDLLKKGAGKKLFISGVQRGVEINELMRLFKQEGSAKAECCIALGGAENTIENARETAAWLEKEGFHSFYLVTANYHMRRALLEFENTVPDLDVTPYPVSPEKLEMKVWWRDPVFRTLIVREYMKYLLETFRYAVTKNP